MKEKTKEKTYKFNPKKDITTYELAIILLTVIRIVGNRFADIPEEMKRHFEEE